MSVLRRDRLGGWTRSFADIAILFVMSFTLNTDTDTDTVVGETRRWSL